MSNQNNQSARLPARTRVVESNQKRPTLLTEDLPAGGVTHEDFKHQGHNKVTDEEDEDTTED